MLEMCYCFEQKWTNKVFLLEYWACLNVEVSNYTSNNKVSHYKSNLMLNLRMFMPIKLNLTNGVLVLDVNPSNFTSFLPNGVLA